MQNPEYLRLQQFKQIKQMENEQIGMAKASRSHQVIIAKLIHGLTEELNSDYIAIPEPNYDDDDRESMQPDVLIIDTENDKLVASIEVTRKQMVKSDIAKCQKALTKYGDLAECFVVEYKPIGDYQYEITSYTKVTREEVVEEVYSELLDINFPDILE